MEGHVLRNLSYITPPYSVSIAVAAVVGESQTVCTPTRLPIACKVYGT